MALAFLDHNGGWNSSLIHPTAGCRKGQRRKGAKGPGQIHFNGIFQTFPKISSIYMPLAGNSHTSSPTIFQAATCPAENQGLDCNERWGEWILEGAVPQSGFLSFFPLFFDFHKEFEGAFRYRVCRVGEVRWTHEREGLMEADVGPMKCE